MSIRGLVQERMGGDKFRHEEKMAGVKKDFREKDKIWSLLFSIILLSFYFIYFLLRIDPKLIYQFQEPVFFFDRYFLTEFLSYPGGLNELFSRFLTQFFYYSWTGALLLVFVFWQIAWNTKRLIRSISVTQPILYLHWIPSVLLLALHSDYRFPFVFSVGLLWALLCINIYLRLAPSNRSLRFLFYFFLHTLLYYLTAGQVFIFSITIIFYEVLHFRRIVLPLLYLLVAAMLPLIGISTLFITNIQDAYTSQLTSFATYQVTWLYWVLYGFFPLVLLLATFEQRYAKVREKKANIFFEKLFYLRSYPARWIHGLYFFLFIVFVSLNSYDKTKKALMLIDYYSRAGEWEKVIEMAKQGLLKTPIVQYQANRALCHSGRLCDELFSLTQHFGADGLFMHGKMYFLFPLQHSDIFFDLGLINESEHWAYEAVSIKGYTPCILQRLVLVNLLEKNCDVAARYLNMLQKTMWHRAWAADYQEFLSDNSDLLASPQFRYLKSAMPETDFLVSPIEPERCLEELLKITGNKMAFEYYMAYCLLEGKIGYLMKHLYQLNYFYYPKIPRHIEEAILVYLSLVGRKDNVFPGLKVSEATTRKFADFNQILEKYGKNAKQARKDLEKRHKDTYWYYALYYYKAKEY